MTPLCSNTDWYEVHSVSSMLYGVEAELCSWYEVVW